MLLTPGTRLGRYEIRALLGAGGGGEVYLAEDTELSRRVALKVLRAVLATPETSDPDFAAEARAAASLNHPNLAAVYDIGRSESAIFIAGEFVEGESLRERLSAGVLPLDQAVDIALQVAAGLAATHDQGLVHCDLKPENIMLRSDGLVKVVDLGLARRTVSCASTASATSRITDQLVDGPPSINGSIAYIAPEVTKGLAPDARADLWGLGVLLFEMIAGRRPFERDGQDQSKDFMSLSGGERDLAQQEFRATLEGEPPMLSTLRDGVPLALESIIRRSLAKNRNERYQTTTEVIADLTRLRAQLQLPFGESTTVADSVMIESPVTGRSKRGTWGSVSRTLVPSIALLRTRRHRFLWTSALLALLGVGSAWWTHTHGSTWLPGVTLFVFAAVGVLAFIMLGRVRATPPAMSAYGVAFRGLLPFQEADRERFYGRRVDKEALLAMVTHQTLRFGVLFGESGCGKTSLLCAGLVPALWQAGYAPLYCRSFSDPLAVLLEECRKRSCLQQNEESALAYLARVSKQLDAPLVVICDQFEEFFANFKTASEREPFIEFVAQCQAQANLPVKFLFSLRSDFLYLINAAFEGRVPDPLLSAKLYHLRNFDEEKAAEIIERSARAAALPFEPGLGRQIARDLAVDHSVAPSELQIVGAQLQSHKIFTREAYRRTGGKEALVHDFLEDVIQASGDAEGARLLLRSLISDENTRVTLPLAEICKRTQRNQEVTGRLLQVFANARLVRELQDQNPWRYELMHEYLIDKINQVTGQVLDATQRANRHFRQYLTNYSLDPKTRIPLIRLWSIRRYSDLPRGERERDLLKRSMRWALGKAAALTLLLALVTTAAAAFLSVNEAWQSVKLSDGHTAAARRVIFSRDGKRLASCGEDGKIIVWDFASRQRIATLTDHQGWVNWIDFSPDGKWLASASQDQTVIIWDAATLKKITVLREHRDSVNGVTFSPDGKWLVSGSGGADDRSVFWLVEGWKKVKEIPSGIGWNQFLFTPDSRQLVEANGRTWDVETGQKIADSFPAGGTYGQLYANGTRSIGIDGGGIVWFHDVLSRSVLNSKRAHQFHGRAAIVSPDGSLAATGAEDIVLWDAPTQTKLARLTYVAEVWGLAFSPDGRWLVSSHNDGAILLWDVQERELAASFSEHSGSVRAVAFSTDGRKVASASEDRSVIIWNVADGRKEATLMGHGTRVTSVAFAPGADWVVTGDQDGHIIRWDSKPTQRRWVLPTTVVPAYSITVSPDGRWVAHTNGVNDSADGRLVVDFYKFATAEHIKGQLYGLAFSPDGRRLVGVTNMGQVIALDTETWKLAARAELNASLICIAFAADGRHFVTGEDEGMVRLWETEGLRQVTLVGQHTARIKAVKFSPDGREVVSCGDDQTICVWNVASRKLVTYLGTHTAPVLAVDFSRDGMRVVSGGQDKSVRLYTRHRTLWGYNLD